MHANERYEALQQKLEILSQFESCKATRQELFQNCFNSVSEALSSIYLDITKSSKHPIGLLIFQFTLS